MEIIKEVSPQKVDEKLFESGFIKSRSTGWRFVLEQVNGVIILSYVLEIVCTVSAPAFDNVNKH